MEGLACNPLRRGWTDAPPTANTPQRIALGDVTNSRQLTDPLRHSNKFQAASKSSMASGSSDFVKPKPSTITTSALPQRNVSAVTGIPSYCYNTRSNSNKKITVFDKGLPTKPGPLNDEYPERPARVSQSFTTQKSPSTGRVAGGGSPSDIGSFNTSQSLLSSPGDTSSEVEFGIAVAKTSRHVDAQALVVKDRFDTSSGLGFHHPSIASLRAPRVCKVAAPDDVGIRSRSLGHIATQKSGSPVLRRPMMSRTARSKFQRPGCREKFDLSRDYKTRLTQTSHGALQAPEISSFGTPSTYNGGVKRGNMLSHSSIVSSSCDERSPFVTDDTRRSDVFGTGATIRFSKDAHEIIMGTSQSDISTEPRALLGANRTCPTDVSSLAKLPPLVSKRSNHNHERTPGANKANRKPNFVQQRLIPDSRRSTFHHGYLESPKVLTSTNTWSLTSKAVSSQSLNSFGHGAPFKGNETGKVMALNQQPSQSRLPRYTVKEMLIRSNEVTSSPVEEAKPIIPLTSANHVSVHGNDVSSKLKGMKAASKPGKGLKGRVSALLRRRSSDIGANIVVHRHFILKRSNGSHAEPLSSPTAEQGAAPTKALPAFRGDRIGQQAQNGREVSQLLPTQHAYLVDMSGALEAAAPEAELIAERAGSTAKTLNSLSYFQQVNNNEPQALKQFQVHPAAYKINERDPFDETGLGYFFDLQLSDAQSSLDGAIKVCQNIEDQELKSTIAVVIQKAGDAILVSREARKANIALSNAVAGLIKESNRLTAAACSAVL